MSDNNRFPEIIVFAGPNGSGKTTVTKLAKVIEPYINADDIKRTVHCSDLDAAVMAEKMREEALAEYRDSTTISYVSQKCMCPVISISMERIRKCPVRHITTISGSISAPRSLFTTGSGDARISANTVS